jgi:glycosyltransferase involved in cell wall biosynthesis/GT2 family glycosyltransferase
LSLKADIVIPLYADVTGTRACIESVFRCSGESLGQVIVINDCSPHSEMAPMLAELQLKHPEMVLITNEANLGFVRSANRGLALRRRDVVLLNNDTVVTPGWLAEMLEVAYAHDRVAAVVPLSNNASICSVPAYCEPTDMRELEGHDLKLNSLPRFTAIPTGVGFCMLMRHVVLNMIGGFDPAYGRGYNEENDWSMRAQTLGFIVLRANRALVYHLGAASFGDTRSELDRANTELLLSRYPYFLDEVSTFSPAAEARIAASLVRRQLGSTSVCISVRHIDTANTHGTDVYALQLLKHLKADSGLRVSALVKRPDQASLLAGIGIDVTASEHSEQQQICHHPAQIFEPEDLRLFLSAPGHAVITFHDLIAWRTPSALRSIEDHERYVAMSFAALHSAQAVIAISDHNRSEILHELHLPPERVHTVHLGVDTEAFRERNESGNRTRLQALNVRRPYLLYLGTDYAHKNLKLLLDSYAIFRHRFPSTGGPVPQLILAGAPSFSLGSLYDREEPWPLGVQYLGSLAAADVRVLYQEALAFVFPSTYEGFGLPVLEAMAAGTPVICSSLTSLPEVAGDAALYIKDFSPEEIATLMLKVAGSADLRRVFVEKGRERVRQFTWQETARRTVQIYKSVLEQPDEISMFQRSMFWNLQRGLPLFEKDAVNKWEVRQPGSGLLRHTPWLG